MGAMVLGLVAATAACKDSGKESARRAEEHAQWLATLAAKDAAELERGMPEGARKLAELFAGGADPKLDPQGAQAALKKVRREVRDLTIAKSTFFALTDANGVAIRNDLEQDVMAGQDLLAPFPALKAALGGQAVKATGVFPGVTGDRDWVYAVPITQRDPVTQRDKVVGSYVSGFPYRAFARHLRTALELELKDRQGKGQDTAKTPLFYVLVFDGTGAYGAPLTPKMNEDALTQYGLVEKTAQGPHQSVLALDGRDFGVGAVRTPALGADVGVAVLRSEL